MHIHIGGDNVIARLDESNRNADQPRFDDITDTLQREWLDIWGNLSTTDRERIAMSANGRTPNDYQSSWETEQTGAYFLDWTQALSCRVVRPHMTMSKCHGRSEVMYLRRYSVSLATVCRNII